MNAAAEAEPNELRSESCAADGSRRREGFTTEPIGKTPHQHRESICISPMREFDLALFFGLTGSDVNGWTLHP